MRTVTHLTPVPIHDDGVHKLRLLRPGKALTGTRRGGFSASTAPETTDTHINFKDRPDREASSVREVGIDHY